MKLWLMELSVVLLAAAGIYCGWRYYQDSYLPERQMQTAIAEQYVLFQRIRPEIPEISGMTETAVSEEHASAGITETAVPEETVPETEIPQTETEQEIFTESGETELQEEMIPEELPETEEIPENPLILCEEENPEAAGWIYIPDTNIDFPVMQGKDNEFYLHHGADGQDNGGLGCPFLDYRCQHDFSGLSSVVYAHNIEGQAMFADIALYSHEEFMQAHPEGYLVLEDGVHTVDFFAYLSVTDTDRIYQVEFRNVQEQADYLEYLRKKAKYLQKRELHEDMHLLLLSTCTFETESARGVLAGIIRQEKNS